MIRRRREIEIFSLSFLDVICCGFGAIILLLVITLLFEPATIQATRAEVQALIDRMKASLEEKIQNSQVVIAPATGPVA